MLTNDILSERIAKVREAKREKLNKLATSILNKIDENFEHGNFTIDEEGHGLTTDITMAFMSSLYTDKDDSSYVTYMDQYSPIIWNIIRDTRGFFSVEIRKMSAIPLEGIPPIGVAIKYEIKIVPNIKEKG